MELTKTDFIQYLHCPKSLWLLKREPNTYPYGEFSAFLKKIVREGYEVERYVRRYFENLGRVVDYQASFSTSDGLFARVDALEKKADGKIVLYEIKSSTSVKTDASHNQLKDACFQLICARRAGQKVDQVYLVYLNGDYKKEGEIDPSKLLVFADVTADVLGMVEETEAEVHEALDFLAKEEIDRAHCSCLQKSRANHCDTFAILNPDIPTPSIYSLPRLSAKKRAEFITEGIFGLSDVPKGTPLSTPQRLVLFAAQSGEPQINIAEIRRFFGGLSFPLYFFDFETYASAIPFVDRASPHKHFPVQYSLHILGADGSLVHKEYLERTARLSDRLIDQMEADIGPEGSIVSWHASFEKTQNREMAKWFPDKAEFLHGLNDRMVDLEDVFKTAYVDARFDGSTSIKKVLPVICPDLGYGDLDVQDGSSAMEAWERMVKAEPDEADGIAGSLLNYCERDTYAMVAIYRFLKGLID